MTQIKLYLSLMILLYAIEFSGRLVGLVMNHYPRQQSYSRVDDALRIIVCLFFMAWGLKLVGAI